MFDYPDKKKFVFTIIDDTDDAIFENIKPVYDLLFQNKILTTKTIWVYPPRDIKQSKGDCLQRPEYLEFVKDLHKKGFEIALHNVGSGSYEREEIIRGLQEFKNHLGIHPNIHVNHSYNPDNLYSGSKRFSFPFNYIIKLLYSQYDEFYGDNPESNFFWGDIHKNLIKYSRNHEIDDINTVKINPYIPYKDKRYDTYSNYWFSSTFAPNQWVFNAMVTPEKIDRLENQGGICILYTHLGYFMRRGKIDPGFVKIIEYLGKKIPVGMFQ